MKMIHSIGNSVLNHYKLAAIVTTLILLVPNSLLKSQQGPSLSVEINDRDPFPKTFLGSYEIAIPVGENKIPGSILLCNEDNQIKGKLSLQLGVTLNISILSTGQEDDFIQFKTSAPVQSASLRWHRGRDSISGDLQMGGNRTFNFFGKKMKQQVTASECDNLFAFEEFQGSEKMGLAFPSLSKDEKLLIFSAYQGDFSKQQLMYMELINGTWTEPQLLPFSGNHSDRAPQFSPNGKRLYFGSTRPVNNEEKSDYDLWYVDYKGKGKWKTPKHIPEINSPAHDYQPSVTKKGIYFTSDREGGLGGQDIYYAKGKKGRFANPVNLGNSVNSEEGDMSAFVNPSEDLMILASGNPNLPSLGNDDLYLFVKKEGKWTFSKSLDDKINSFANEYGAFVSRDGKWLYYTSDVKPWAKIYRTKWK